MGNGMLNMLPLPMKRYPQVKLPTGKYIEVLARKRFKRLSLEMLLLFETLEAAEGEIISKVDLFVKNATFHKLFETDENRKKESSVVMPGRVGTWKGPMTNTRGGKLTQSQLIVQEAKRKWFKGSWHDDWQIKGARVVGNVVSWEHEGMANKCRDYKVRLEFLNDGLSAVLFYQVHDSCREPRNYSGVMQLKKVAN